MRPHASPVRDDEISRHVKENRRSTPAKLRRDRKHCPVCVAPLKKIARRTRLRKSCTECGAQPSPLACPSCRAFAVWAGTGCMTCGHLFIARQAQPPRR
jgi:hypothetical protein